MKNLGTLRGYLLRYPGRLTLGIAAILGMSLVGLLQPLVVGRAIDALSLEVSGRALLLYGGTLVAIAVVQGALSYAQRMTLVAVSRDVEFDLRNEYFGRLLELPLSFYQRQHTGDLMARGTNDLQAVRMLCGPAIMYAGNTLFTATGALAFMIYLHPRLTAAALVTMPLVALATKVIGARIHVLFDAVQEQFGVLSTRVQENLAGARVVRAYAREESEEKVFGELNRGYVERGRRLIAWDAAFRPLLQLLIGAGFVVVLLYGGRLVLAGELTVGSFVTFNFFLMKLVWPMIAIGWVINLAQRGSASLGRILEVLRTEPEIRDRPDAAAPDRLEPRVEMRDVSFAYGDGPAVLREISLTVAPGTTTAIVGRTGSGKSTLLSLVPRLLEPPPESVFVGGRDVRTLPLAALRRHCAVVPQETVLFSATLLDNIRMSRPEASPDEVLDAARTAGLEPDLERFPEGLDTLVGERGVTLSGGQKQRVALARALVRQPPILLLDDCLSAVDTETEERILTGLAGAFEGRTVLLVSHRISTVRHADSIGVLDGGRLVEHGSHEELLALGGVYADLERRQRLEEELGVL